MADISEISTTKLTLYDRIVQSTPVKKYRETEGIKDIGTNFWNQGRTQEIAERYVHLDDHEERV